jgi:hypothetical protein
LRGSAPSRSGPNICPQAAKRRGCSAPLQSLARFAVSAAGGHDLYPAPQGVSIIPLIDTLVTDFELILFGYKHYILHFYRNFEKTLFFTFFYDFLPSK